MRITIQHGNIARAKAGAIVNPARSNITSTGGLSGPLLRAGGPAVLQACHDIRHREGNIDTGHAVATTAGHLQADKLIHTVGPQYKGGSGNEAQQLKNCYLNSLNLAQSLGVTSIAFPEISTGVYEYPEQEAADIALAAASEFLAQHPGFEHIYFVVRKSHQYQLYTNKLAAMGQA